MAWIQSVYYSYRDPQVHFPASLSGSSKLPIILALERLDASGLHGHPHSWAYICTDRHKIKIKQTKNPTKLLKRKCLAYRGLQTVGYLYSKHKSENVSQLYVLEVDNEW